MSISDRIMSIANMTKGVMSDRDVEMVTPLSDQEKMELNKFIRKLGTSDKDKSMLTRSPDGSIKAREVEVAGEFEDLLMKKYEDAVEGGYKGTFYDFLIDQMDPEFDPAESIRVSKLAEQIRGIPSAMDMKMLRKMITG